jgi:hypothetical protein
MLKLWLSAFPKRGAHKLSPLWGNGQWGTAYATDKARCTVISTK